jgi:hypothetical protein
MGYKWKQETEAFMKEYGGIGAWIFLQMYYFQMFEKVR